MQEPVSELDERFSDPGAKATPWAKAREVLETAQTAVGRLKSVDRRFESCQGARAAGQRPKLLWDCDVVGMQVIPSPSTAAMITMHDAGVEIGERQDPFGYAEVVPDFVELEVAVPA